MVLIINISGIIIIYSFIFLTFNLNSSLTISWTILWYILLIPIFIYYNNEIELEINTIDINNYLTIIKEDTIFIILLFTLLIFFYGFFSILML